MRVFNVTILSVLATVLIGAGLLLGLPGDFSERALWLTVFIPVIWTAFMFYCYWDKKVWRVTTALIGICLIGIGIVLTTPTPV
ncbi:hypothetical protein [Kordiimonas aquimaris]|uniref:hypothetical protein n=1 Tax=Kordiimonas aquimaris TaxID=707591 RepID=UPI0021D37FD6|nr:hypothetical protein [Kordiimonas aquimaris]